MPNSYAQRLFRAVNKAGQGKIKPRIRSSWLVTIINKTNKAGQGKIKPKDALDCYSADSGVEAVE
jgi:hypothetical protein